MAENYFTSTNNAQQNPDRTVSPNDFTSYNNQSNTPQEATVNNPDRTIITSSAGVNVNDSLIIPSINSKTIPRNFGKQGDYIELHIYNTNLELIHTISNFDKFTVPPENTGLSNVIQMNPPQVLNSLGYTTGKYILHLNVLKNKIFNEDYLPFNLIEISNSREELKTIAVNVDNATLDPAVTRFIAEIESSAYFKEFSLNFGNDLLIPCVNILLDRSASTYQILFKTLDWQCCTVG